MATDNQKAPKKKHSGDSVKHRRNVDGVVKNRDSIRTVKKRNSTILKMYMIEANGP